MVLHDAHIIPDACLNQPKLCLRPLISPEEAMKLAALFKIFANNNRLRLLHVLARTGEIRVMDLAAALDMKIQAVSNQLQRLADQGVIEARREGQNFFYRLINPCLPNILEHGLGLLEASQAQTD